MTTYLVWAELKFIVWPLACILVAFVVGMIINRVIFRQVQQRLPQTPGTLFELFITSLHGIPVLWVTIVGIYGAIYTIPMNPNLLSILEKTLLVLSLLSVLIVLSRTLVGLVNIYAQKAAGVFPSTSLFVNLTEIITYSIGIMIILQSIGISVTPILTALGVGGLAVALALQDTLANLFAGVYITLARQIKINDYIKLNSGEEGYIADITWRNTTLNMLSNNVVVVPNAKIASSIITNHSLPDKQISVVIPVGVSYGSDLEQVEAITVTVATAVMQEVAGGVPDYQPVVRFTAFAESNITFNIVLRAQEFADQYFIRHELIKRLYVAYQQQGIVMAFPSRTVYLAGRDTEKRRNC